VAEALGAAGAGAPLPTITEVDPPADAGDIFDSFLGHLAGRAQPAELPTPEDWRLLYSGALAFYRVGPWAAGTTGST
jgi:hypothetical protein